MFGNSWLITLVIGVYPPKILFFDKSGLYVINREKFLEIVVANRGIPQLPPTWLTERPLC